MMVSDMEELTNRRILRFDAYYTNRHIQMLKLLCSILPSDTQKKLAIYIKFLELGCALKYDPLEGTDLFMGQNNGLFPEGEQLSEVAGFLEELIPFADAKEKDQIASLCHLMQELNRMQEMKETLSMIKELFPEGTDSESPFDIFQFLGKE